MTTEDCLEEAKAITARDWLIAPPLRATLDSRIALALRNAYQRGVSDCADWHRKKAKQMEALIEDGKTGRIGADVAAKAATWKTHHEYCAGWIMEARK